MSMRKQCASVYKRGGRLFFATSSQTTGRYGLWIEAGPHLAAGIADGPSAVGDRLVEALNASRQGVEYPEDVRKLEGPLLKLAGVKSWKVFAKGAAHCYVERDEDGIRIIPSEPDTGGFRRRKDQTVKVPETSPADQLGQALLDAVTGCE
jgi:hypothetical protein